MRYKEAGIENEILEWKNKMGISNVKDIKRWKKACHDVSNCLKWKRNGYSVEEVIEFKKYGISNVHEVLAWVKSGVVNTPGMIGKWKKIVLYPGRAKYWIEHNGIRDIESIKKWHKLGITDPGIAERWLEHCGKDFEKIKIMKESGKTPYDCKK